MLEGVYDGVEEAQEVGALGQRQASLLRTTPIQQGDTSQHLQREREKREGPWYGRERAIMLMCLTWRLSSTTSSEASDKVYTNTQTREHTTHRHMRPHFPQPHKDRLPCFERVGLYLDEWWEECVDESGHVLGGLLQ